VGPGVGVQGGVGAFGETDLEAGERPVPVARWRSLIRVFMASSLR